MKEYTISFDDDYIIINLEEDFNGELKLNYKVTDDVDAFVNVSKSVLIDKVGTDEILFDGNGIITKPVDLNPDNNEISKFSPEGSATGIRVFSNNSDPLGDVIYKVKDDTYGAFDVNQETGVVYLSNPSLLKHIKNPNHEIIVEASSTNPLDNRVSYETFEIAVNEGNHVHVVDLQSTYYSYAALRSDGSVLTWGTGNVGDLFIDQLSSGVVELYSNRGMFLALKDNGSVFSWGINEKTEKYSEYNYSLSGSNIVDVIPGRSSHFAVLDTNGNVHYIGNQEDLVYTDFNNIVSELTDVDSVYSTGNIYTALRNDGSIVVWGDERYGASSNTPTDHIQDIVSISNNIYAFAGIKDDGSVLTWGYGPSGGDSSSISENLTGVEKVVGFASRNFAALKSDGSIVIWEKLIILLIKLIFIKMVSLIFLEVDLVD